MQQPKPLQSPGIFKPLAWCLDNSRLKLLATGKTPGECRLKSVALKFDITEQKLYYPRMKCLIAFETFRAELLDYSVLGNS